MRERDSGYRTGDDIDGFTHAVWTAYQMELAEIDSETISDLTSYEETPETQLKSSRRFDPSVYGWKSEEPVTHWTNVFDK